MVIGIIEDDTLLRKALDISLKIKVIQRFLPVREKKQLKI